MDVQAVERRIREAFENKNTTLDLSFNQLTELPESLSKLTNLQSLDLSFNQLTELPESLAKLTNLQTLDLSSNQLTELPESLTKLTNLQTLYLSSNQLTELPESLAKLTNLQTLDLSSNQLTELPESLSKLTNLQTLDLSYNQLTELPESLSKLTNLQALYLGDNPLSPSLQGAYDQGLDALRIYLSSLSDTRLSEDLFEAKLVLVGEGGVGKTTLQKALTGNNPQEGEQTTHGAQIDIQALKLPHPDLDTVEIQFNIWDFGGQDVYRVTHQFFFSPQSLYLVVWEPRRGVQQCQVEDWLKMIQLRVGETAKVLIISTHCHTGERIARIDQPVLMEKYGSMIMGFHQVDSLVYDPETNEKMGIASLKKKIAEVAKELKQMGMRFNRHWRETRDQLLKLDIPSIKYTQLSEIAAHNGLDDLATKTLTAMMHNLGYIVYYSDDERLREDVVLQPEWLTKAIGYVLEDHATQDANGILLDNRLFEVWHNHPFPNEPRYGEAQYSFFLKLMEKFDVLYRIEEGTASLVAQHVSQVRPELPWLGEEAPTPSCRKLGLACVLEEIPEGIIPWMIVRTHTHAHHYPQSNGTPQRLHWQKGMFLKYGNHGEAYLELNNQELIIYAEATWPDYFMSVLHQTLHNLITEKWPGLSDRYFFAVPCPEQPNDKPCKGRFNLDSLRQFHLEGDETIRCQTCRSRQNIETLLYGFRDDPIAIQRQHLEHLTQSVDQIQSTLDGMKSRIDGYIFAVMNAIASETKHGPGLFSLTPVKGNWRNVTTQRVRLQFFCEEEGHQHPLRDDLGIYEFDAPREWLIKVAPYLNFIAGVLKLATSIAAPSANLLWGESTMKALDIQNQFDVLKEGSGHLLEGEFSPDVHLREELDDIGGHHHPLKQVERSGLLAIHAILREQDRNGDRLGLKRVPTYTGNYLWVCEQHFQERQSKIPDSFDGFFVH